MATSPLFVADADVLKARLRLSGVSVDAEDTLAIIDEAVLRARLDFNRRLGTQRVAQIKIITEVADPISDDQLLRSLASVVEVKLVTRDLMRRLPQAWMDASGDLNKAWNEEAPFRERAPSEINREIERLSAEIEEDMQMLAEEEEMGEESQFRVFDGSPDCPTPRIGASIRPKFPRSRQAD